MAIKLRPPPKVTGYVVMGGRRPLGGPAYLLVQPGPEVRLFPTREQASDRARQIAPTPDWWVEPIWDHDVV